MRSGLTREDQVSYYISTQFDGPFDQALSSTKEALREQGFRIFSQIDMRDSLKQSLGVDFPHYLILGACNPPLTYRALQAENKNGTMLPCNVVIQQQHTGEIEVSAVDPVASMQAINNVVVDQVADDIRSRLQSVIDEIARSGKTRT